MKKIFKEELAFKKNITLIFILTLLLLTPLSFTSGGEKEVANIAKQIEVANIAKQGAPEAVNQKALSAKKRAEHFATIRDILADQEVKNAFEEAFKDTLNFYEVLVKQGYSPNKDIDSRLTEGQLMVLLEENPSFAKFAQEHISKISKGQKKGLENFFKAFDELDEKLNLRKQLSQLNPIDLYVLKGRGETDIRFLDVYVNHKIILDDGKAEEGVDILEKKKEFIRSLKGEIMVNVFDFGLMDLAEELVLKAQNGHKVTVGIDAKNIEEKESAWKVAKYLSKNGVTLVEVDSVGLNHQKIIAGGFDLPGEGKVILSSGNFTASGIHSNGDLGDTNISHKSSIPNANHFVEIHSDQLATLVQHELIKTLELKLRGKEYPISSAYLIPGEKLKGYGQTSLTIAFSPGGGLKDIISNLISPEVVKGEGPLHLATFAFSNVLEEAILQRLEKQSKKLNSNLNFLLFSVVDFSFAVREWSGFLKMLGFELIEDTRTQRKLYRKIPDEENKWLKRLGKKVFHSLQKFIFSPKGYGNDTFLWENKEYDVSSKIHHKIIVTSKDTAFGGSSFNFSNAAQSNQEQFVIIRDPRIAEKIRAIGRGLAEGAPSVYRRLYYKNRRLQLRNNQSNDALDLVVESSKEETEKAIKNFKKETNHDNLKIRTILLREFSKFKAKGNPSIHFSFDIDDNILNLMTDILVYHKKTDKVKGIDTELWAKVKHQIGKKGTKYENYEIRETSFDNFGDKSNGVETFLLQLKEAMEHTSEERNWRGAVWNQFTSALDNPITSKNTTFITARGHSREGILLAFEFLKEKGFIKYLPLKENIWPVTAPDFSQNFKNVFKRAIKKGTVDSPSEAKAEIMIELLDKINKKKISKNHPEYTSPDGKEEGKYQLWGFSDDDLENFKQAKKVLQKEVNKNKWPNVKIFLYYTGKGLKDKNFIVLRPRAPPRKPTPYEIIEWLKVHYDVNTPKNCRSAFL